MTHLGFTLEPRVCAETAPRASSPGPAQGAVLRTSRGRDPPRLGNSIRRAWGAGVAPNLSQSPQCLQFLPREKVSNSTATEQVEQWLHCTLYAASFLYPFFFLIYTFLLAYSCFFSLEAQLVKNPPATRETWVRSLSWEDPMEKGTATHSSVLAWRIPWGCKESDATEQSSLYSCFAMLC